jgi:2,5-diamino-6-(ribosylamino)-4(3H)-pyrimidinone 5'-phosphate reductase
VPAASPDRPRVVAHVAISVDGATTGFAADVATFYDLAATWREDVTLTGADTILAQEEALATAPQPGPRPDGPLLAVVDSRARVQRWTALRDAGHWSGVLAVSSSRTPPRPGFPGDEVRVGDDRVDLAALLAVLGRRAGVATVRVDSGGGLLGALLAGGLVDEVSLLVHPVLAGTAGGRRWYGAQPPGTALALEDDRQLAGGLVWLRYRTAR